MDKQRIEQIALFRYGIIAPIVNRVGDEDIPIKQRFLIASQKSYVGIDGELINVSWSTIERWYYNYTNHGFKGITPPTRSDEGISRKLDDDLKEQIKYIKTEYPRIPATLVYSKLIENGSIKEKEISLSTINRYINTIKKEEGLTSNKDMRRYEREHINEVWCADTSYGPYITIGKKKCRTYIIALIDDASRMIVGIGIFLNDNYENFLSVIKKAISTYGKPKILNLDNGSTYKNNQKALLSARVGFSLNYCAPYTPTSKSKIERWFRTMKDQFFATLNINDFKDIKELETALFKYVKEYNNTPHSSLKSKTPNDRFFEESKLIKRLNNKQIEESFLFEIERTVSSDNVVMINKEEYEVPYRYSKQKITLRYSSDLSKVYVVKGNELEEIKILNKHDNSHIKREVVKLCKGE